MWQKYKQIYEKQAQLPTVIKTNIGYRIFYSYRLEGQSNVNYFEIDKNLDVVYENSSPVLSPGFRGNFDDKGVMPSCLVGDLLYYTGWNVDKGHVPYGHGIGIAQWIEEKNQFERIFSGPIIDRSYNIPYLANSPFVRKQYGTYKVWFCNGIGWDGDFPMYNIYSFESDTPTLQFPRSFKYEVGGPSDACSRPFVMDSTIYFSKRTRITPYGIFDGDQEQLKRSSEGWDSEMVCYPYIVDDLMFYNGNGYGKTGIGVAKCTKN